MKLETVQEMWASFEAAVFAGVRDVPPVQRQEMRRAFMAGAYAMFLAVCHLGESGEAEAAGLAYLARLRQELEAFYRAVKDGRA